MKPHDVNIGHYNEMVPLFHKESDRAAAVLAGSFLENFLFAYLKTFLVVIEDGLFGESGPLSTFYQKIAISAAIGIIDKGIQTQLTAIKQIRNHFAHHPFEATFNDAVLNKHFDKLPVSKDPSFNTKGDGTPLTDRKWIYLLSIGIIVTKMTQVMAQKKCEEQAIKSWKEDAVKGSADAPSTSWDENTLKSWSDNAVKASADNLATSSEANVVKSWGDNAFPKQEDGTNQKTETNGEASEEVARLLTLPESQAIDKLLRNFVETQAWSLYVGRGKVHGNDLQDWFNARAQLGLPDTRWV